jgi:hypothetical protein
MFSYHCQLRISSISKIDHKNDLRLNGLFLGIKSHHVVFIELNPKTGPGDSLMNSDKRIGDPRHPVCVVICSGCPPAKTTFCPFLLGRFKTFSFLLTGRKELGFCLDSQRQKLVEPTNMIHQR